MKVHESYISQWRSGTLPMHAKQYYNLLSVTPPIINEKIKMLEDEISNLKSFEEFVKDIMHPSPE